jgi:hypothetical protein
MDAVSESKLVGRHRSPHAAVMNFSVKIFITLLAGSLLGGACALAQSVQEQLKDDAPQTISTSPDGRFLVRRSQAESGERGGARKQIEICSASGKILYAWISGLGFTTMFWSPDNRYLALNDMPGEKGDLVRIFSLDPVKSEVISVREPNGEQLLKEEEEHHGSFLSSIDQVHLRIVEWREGRLWCELSGKAHPKREPMVHVPFHHLWVFGMKGGQSPVLEQEWTLTDPKEHPVRDH